MYTTADHSQLATTGPVNLITSDEGQVLPAFSGQAAEGAYDAASPQGLFEGLDGRVVTVSNHWWRVSVFGVFDDDSHRWLQLGLEGHRDCTLTLRMRRNGGVRHAIYILSSWLANPAVSTHVTNVA